MFNLLPEQEKNEILSEYKIRRGIVALIFLFVLGLVALISLVPSYLLSSAKVAEGKSNVASFEQSSIASEEPSLQDSLDVARVKLAALSPAATQSSLRSVIDAIIAARTESIRINGFLFSKSSADSGTATDTIEVVGIAADRDSLSSFQDALKANPLFSNVDLPVSNFAKDTNEDFSLELSGNF